MEVGEMEGVTLVEADQDTKTARITYGEPATEAKILALLEEINYPVAEQN
jgi:copper chaperone CopZ